MTSQNVKKEIFLEETTRAISNHSLSNQSEQLKENTITQPIDGFVTELNRLDIQLWIEGDRLRCNAPKGALTPDLKAQLAERKAEILEFLSKRVHSQRTSHEKISAFFKAEAVLDSTIYPEATPTQVTAAPKYLFLTGATGFLGAFLLNELLQQTQADVYCLVRAGTSESAQKKLQNCLESYLLWEEQFKHRIIPVIGDLSQPLLGLSEAQFQKLASQVDAIYHNGARVHHASPYSLLKASNVLGTQEVLRLACQTRVKPVHFISATSIFSPNGNSGTKVIREQDSIDDQVPWGDGYNESKWVAEKSVTTARDRGIPVSIYRLGRISGHSQTGVFNLNDFLYRLIIGCVHLGSVPDAEEMLDMVPIDYASQAIVYLSQQPVSCGKAFHIVHPNPVPSNILLETLRSMGYSIQQISYSQWRTKLLHIAENSPEHVLYPLVSLFPARSTQSQPDNSATLTFDCQNTLDGLSGTSIHCPPIDTQLLHTYFSYLIQRGILAAPPTLAN